MSGSVFDQYQKYFESLITRHRTTCQLENQNHKRDTPEQKQQKPQQQDYTPSDDGRMRRQMPPWQPEYPVHAPQQHLPMVHTSNYPQQQQYDTPDDYYNRGSGRQNYQYPHPQQQYDPEEYQYRAGFRPQQQMQSPVDSRLPVVSVGQDSTFRPDGRADAAADPNKKPQTICYPFGVNGYQGGGPCGPCNSCTSKPAAPPTVTSAAQQPQKQQQKPCDSKDCSSGWRADGDPDEASSVQARDNLPLGVNEPFVIGPTTYQYFFDHPAD